MNLLIPFFCIVLAFFAQGASHEHVERCRKSTRQIVGRTIDTAQLIALADRAREQPVDPTVIDQITAQKWAIAALKQVDLTSYSRVTGRLATAYKENGVEPLGKILEYLRTEQDTAIKQEQSIAQPTNGDFTRIEVHKELPPVITSRRVLVPYFALPKPARPGTIPRRYNSAWLTYRTRKSKQNSVYNRIAAYEFWLTHAPSLEEKESYALALLRILRATQKSLFRVPYILRATHLEFVAALQGLRARSTSSTVAELADLIEHQGEEYFKVSEIASETPRPHTEMISARINAHVAFILNPLRSIAERAEHVTLLTNLLREEDFNFFSVRSISTTRYRRLLTVLATLAHHQATGHPGYPHEVDDLLSRLAVQRAQLRITDEQTRFKSTHAINEQEIKLLDKLVFLLDCYDESLADYESRQQRHKSQWLYYFGP